MFMKRDNVGFEAVPDDLRGTGRACPAGRVQRSREHRSGALVEGAPLLLALVILGLTAVALRTPPPGPPAARQAAQPPADERAELCPPTARFMPDATAGPTTAP
jgi:hypothetical protein